MKLVDEWKSAWKYLSVQANAIGAAMAVGYASMYEQLKENLPPKYMVAITGAVFVLGIVGRVVSQTKEEDK